jgi:hypothetical protein
VTAVVSKGAVPAQATADAPGTHKSRYPLASHHSLIELAEVLFTTGLQESEHPAAELVRDTVEAALDRCKDDCRACVAVLAQEYGDHPVTAVHRMHWAVTEVGAAFGPYIVAGAR